MKHLTHTLWRTAVVLGLGVPGVTLAANNPFETAQNLAGNVGTAAGVGEQKSLETIVGGIINVVLGFLGIVLLGYMLFAGFQWMTAGGDEKKVANAKDMIKNAIIGLVIIVAAFAISSFVLGSLVNVTQQ
ncbi:pilin [Patescibacteria group bacterium]|nr:pilin [Patescibacteria group bacterium]MBU1448537.1 pilin [Patescibacteria group bacterium]MBU2613627.1 pilin [Patescibacteria group bacterium]